MDIIQRISVCSVICVCSWACEPIEDEANDARVTFDASLSLDTRSPLDASADIARQMDAAIVVPIDASASQFDRGMPRTEDIGFSVPAMRDGSASSALDMFMSTSDGGPAPDLDMAVSIDAHPDPPDGGSMGQSDLGGHFDAALVNAIDGGGVDGEPMFDAGPQVMPPRCAENMWYCEQSQHCIPRRYLCDGSDDCEFFGEDETPDVCVPENIPERCFAERPFDDQAVACFTGCWSGRGCPEGHLCVRSHAGEICVRDCRQLGCPRNLLCQDNGYCTVDPAYVLIGAVCQGHQECGEGRDCGGWGEIEGQDIDDPPLVFWMPVEQLRRVAPDVTPRCRGTCEECQASAGTTWCINGGCGPCDHFQEPLDDVQGRCEIGPSYCWSGACECVDTQSGLCLIPAR